MNTLDFSFDDSPWERFLAGRQPGDTVNAAHFLTLLEQETEEAVEDAFAALEAKKLLLDISQLPVKHHQGQAALRLRQEAELAQHGMDVSGLSETDPLRLYLEEIAQIPLGEDEASLAEQAAQGQADDKQHRVLALRHILHHRVDAQAGGGQAGGGEEDGLVLRLQAPLHQAAHHAAGEDAAGIDDGS